MTVDTISFYTQEIQSRAQTLKTALIVIVDNWGPQSTALCMVPVVRKVIMKVGPVIDLF